MQEEQSEETPEAEETFADEQATPAPGGTEGESEGESGEEGEAASEADQ